MTDLWHQIATLPQGAATFLGTLVGSSLGLVAILFGALFNAHLNRKRDDRLRQEETVAVRVALRAELLSIKESAERNAEDLAKPPAAGEEQPDFVVPDVSHSVRVMPALSSKLLLLNSREIRALVDAHVILDQFCELLIIKGGKIVPNNREGRTLVLMPGRRAATVAALERGIVEAIDEALTELN